MNRRPVIPIRPAKLAGSETVLHVFSHAGAHYEVHLRNIEGAEFAALRPAGTSSFRMLHPFPDEVPVGLSDHSRKAGYIAVAEWLVKTGRWPEGETKATFEQVSIAPAA
jgi:hypothetical protein